MQCTGNGAKVPSLDQRDLLAIFKFTTHLNFFWLAFHIQPVFSLTYGHTHSSSSLQEVAGPAFRPSPFPFPRGVRNILFWA